MAVIQVFESADIPHLCVKEHPKILRKGALYVRPRKMPETSEVADSVELREFLDLATEKALRAFISTAKRAGATLGSDDTVALSWSSDEQYDEQRDEAWR
ncbi:MAG: hypothetical protein ACRDTC_16975 [Pseudonocardiaceae bacterium]